MHPIIESAKSKLDSLSDRARIPRQAGYAVAGIAAVAALSAVVGLLTSHPRPQPAPARAGAAVPAVAQAPALAAAVAPTTAAPAASAAVATFALPALAAPPADPQPGFTVDLLFPAQGQPPQRVGTSRIDAQTASLALASPQPLAAFTPPGKAIQLHISGYFRVDSEQAQILFAKLAGPLNAGATALIDGRADPVLSVQHQVNPWTGQSVSTQSNSPTMHLAPGWHRLEIIAETQQPASATGGDVLDLFIKGQADPVPTALQLYTPASTTPVAASAPAQGVKP